MLGTLLDAVAVAGARLRAAVLVEYGLMLVAARSESKRAKHIAGTLVVPKLTPRYLHFVRMVEPAPEPGGRKWRLVVQGVPRRGAHAPAGVGGFFRHYLVAAPHQDHALALAARIEPEREWASLSIDTLEPLGDADGEYGVLDASGAVWYPPPTTT